MPTRTAKRATPRRAAGSAELLLEVGTEELPYQFIRPALASLAGAMERLLKEHRLAFESVRTAGTPRRLAVVVAALASSQAPATTEAMGPSKAVAFDAEGRPTKAALGFAAGHKVPVEALEVRATPKGEYVFAVKRDPGRSTPAVLAELLPALIGGIAFPKAMRWNATGTRFARPVRWLLAVYDGRVVPCAFGGLPAGNRTFGHRFLGPRAGRPLPVKDFKSYCKVLAQHGVEVDPDRRRDLIAKQVEDLARTAKGVLHHDEELLDQAVYTVEAPKALLGRFHPEYLSVPKAVLMTAMKEHQGFFSVVGRNGALLPAFVSVSNMPVKDLTLIREGNERVLAARLADARFFYDEDRKVRLSDRVPKLTQVTFHQKLGHLGHKAERIKRLAAHLAGALGLTALAETAARAAWLCKADLLTGMVGEFPTLQGVMGGEYARHDGEPAEIAAAIAEHYLPPSGEGPLPETPAGKVVSLADRLDTLAAFFHVGLIPSGSEDPFALRRHATAVVRVLIESALRLDLAEAVETALAGVAAGGFLAGAGAGRDTRRPLMEFLFDRVRHVGRTSLGLRNDVMEAVLRPALAGRCEPVDLIARMTALQAMTARPEFDPLMVGFKRAHRIVEKEVWDRKPVDPARFQHDAESALHGLTQQADRRVPESMARRDYAKALESLVALKPSIDGFFNAVMVNADEPEIRANRLSLLASVDAVFMSYADFSQIAVQAG